MLEARVDKSKFKDEISLTLGAADTLLAPLE
jgi:hypothetical protein